MILYMKDGSDKSISLSINPGGYTAKTFNRTLQGYIPEFILTESKLVIRDGVKITMSESLLRALGIDIKYYGKLIEGEIELIAEKGSIKLPKRIMVYCNQIADTYFMNNQPQNILATIDNQAKESNIMYAPKNPYHFPLKHTRTEYSDLVLKDENDSIIEPKDITFELVINECI